MRNSGEERLTTIDLQYGINNASFFENGILKINKGGGLTLLATDSSAHLCSILYLNTLNPAYAGWWPTGTGRAEATVICTELGSHTIRGQCWVTGAYTLLNIQVMEGQLYADTWYNRTVEILEGDHQSFSTLDYLNHWCWIFGFNQLNSAYKDWAPSGQGSAWGEPVCNIPGNFTISGFCIPSGVYDQVIAKVKPVIITPDEGQLGFHQTWVNGEVGIEVTVRGDHYCMIFGLNQLNPDYNEVPDGYGSCYAPVTCTVKGDHTIMGVDCETWDVDYTVIRVSEIVETRWEQIAGPLDDNPNAGGGKRIFPDWQLSDLPNGPSTPRSWVQVHAIVDPPPSDPNQPLRVRFMPYDADDPSADQAPIDWEFGSDNRGSWQWVHPSEDGGWSVYMPVTTSGDAAAAFQVSTQPGDNFRVNAQLDPIYYTCIAHQGVTDGHLDITGSEDERAPDGEVTPMLTVWRRFHVEGDSMAALEDWKNYVSGMVREVTAIGSGWRVSVDWWALDHVHVVDRFCPGVMRDEATGVAYAVNRNGTEDQSGRFTAEVSGAVAPVVGNAVSFYDDDFVLATNPPSSRNLLPQLPDTSLAQSLFRAAYLEVDDENGIWNQTTKSAQPYYEGPTAGGRDANGKGSVWYWLGYVIGAFQESEARSWDPPGSGVTGTPLGKTLLPSGGAAVYYETIRDSGSDSSKRAVIAHELGHHLVGSWHAMTNRTIIAIDPQYPKRIFQVRTRK